MQNENIHLSLNKVFQTTLLVDAERTLEIFLESVHFRGGHCHGCKTPTNVQSDCLADTRAGYSFLGTFVMMGLGRILKINLRLMRAVTE